MLSFDEFQLLNEDLQTQVLSWDGVYLDMVRSAANLNVELYSLYTFYVEIYFDKETEEPVFLKAFRDMRKLDPYMDAIDISAVLNIHEEGL